ncbi:Nodulation efficiency family protein, NfeD [Alteracholeplasma palmae J233]|uniref:Nodulation efficiency family protein, NfeD n=1 Tax=Alteracholeplasma palmae (strain ATCC 49389 / J233) TaxID=1318466 RepID=U4KKY1_ALTPJ|nr:NfeD family protein [Alteracholeplasma palmae]CCV64358.1 Nodulation efficiency family protein, NfeD [Alteracholeplasma palmae J233]
MDVMVWVWLGIFVLSVTFEFVSLELVSIWFAIAAIPSLILAMVNIPLHYQLIVFFIISCVLIFLTRPVVLKYFKRNEVKTNVDAYIGKVAVVTKTITPNNSGLVKFEHLIWTAISDAEIKEDALVKILAVEGVKLIVEEIDNDSIH